MKTFLIAVIIFFFIGPANANKTKDVEHVLNSLHASASSADAMTYFNLFTDDAVFIGTDVTEYWSIDEFKAFALPYFNKGTGWSYVPRNRDIKFSKSGKTAWFHEILDNESYGTTRGTGVLIHTKKRGWLISQYHLTIPIPNDLAAELTGQIKTLEANENKIKKTWSDYIESKGGLTWGESKEYPKYDKVKEGDTLMIQLNKGPCLMEFYHSRWRRANDVMRWDDAINDYKGCPYVFD